MIRATHKLTVLLGCDLALSPDPNATRMANDLTHHVLSHRVTAGLQILFEISFSPADWPLGDVVWPDVRGH